MGYPPRQLWALAVSGVLTELNSAHHHELGGWGHNEHTANWCRNTLKDFYGIESAEEHGWGGGPGGGWSGFWGGGCGGGTSPRRWRGRG